MMGSTMSSHVGFNDLHIKSDKLVGGCISWLLIWLLILPLSIPSVVDWWGDDKPYITSAEFPYNTTLDGFERDEEQPLSLMNTFFYKVTNHEYKTFSTADIERYLDFQIVRLKITHDDNGIATTTY